MAPACGNLVYRLDGTGGLALFAQFPPGGAQLLAALDLFADTNFRVHGAINAAIHNTITENFGHLRQATIEQIRESLAGVFIPDGMAFLVPCGNIRNGEGTGFFESMVSLAAFDHAPLQSLAVVFAQNPATVVRRPREALVMAARHRAHGLFESCSWKAGPSDLP